MQTNPASRLDAAIAALHAADFQHTAAGASPEAEAALCAAVDAVHAEAEAILSRPAGSLADLKAKAKALEWAMRGASPGEVMIDEEPATVAALRGLLADIAALPVPAR